MAKHLLSARQVQVARVGDTFDGDGLILRVKAKSASWVLRYSTSNGKRRELGLGTAYRSSIEAAGARLTRARKAADEARDQLDRGIDPIEARRLATTAEHHESLRREFPHMRSIGVLGKEVTGWQVLPADAADFEEAALRVCELVLQGDPQIGKIPKRRLVPQARKQPQQRRKAPKSAKRRD